MHRAPMGTLLLFVSVSGAAQAVPDWGRQVLGQDAAASGAFTCEASVQDGRWSGACFHPALAALRAAEREAPSGPNYRATVCRLLAERHQVTPVGALEVSADGVVRQGRSLPDTVTVYRLLYVPQATEASLGVTDEDPGDGRPWLHQAGSCTAHVMWSERLALH